MRMSGSGRTLGMRVSAAAVGEASVVEPAACPADIDAYMVRTASARRAKPAWRSYCNTAIASSNIRGHRSSGRVHLQGSPTALRPGELASSHAGASGTAMSLEMANNAIATRPSPSHPRPSRPASAMTRGSTIKTFTVPPPGSTCRRCVRRPGRTSRAMALSCRRRPSRARWPPRRWLMRLPRAVNCRHRSATGGPVPSS